MNNGIQTRGDNDISNEVLIMEFIKETRNWVNSEYITHRCSNHVIDLFNDICDRELYFEYEEIYKTLYGKSHCWRFYRYILQFLI
jgi:hypothetical protein